MKNTWRFQGNEFEYVREVLDSGFGSSTSGSMNNRFEAAFAQKVGAPYAVTFNSGTSTLHAALAAVGVGPGDEVITPALTVISNGYVILAQNAIPVFADVQPDTFNIDPDDVERKITSRTKAIMPVSLYGLPCDLERLHAIQERTGIPIIHDAAQAHMAEIHGVPIAGLAPITSYSLENSKHITTGDGGIVVTTDEAYAASMRKMGSLGYAALTSADGRIRANKLTFQNPGYKRHDDYGCNYRMPEVAAALGLAQVERIEHFINLRISIARLYEETAARADYLIPQASPPGFLNTHWCFAATFEREDVSWKDFRDKYVEFGGDGIYAAWALLYQELYFESLRFRDRAPAYYSDVAFQPGICPVSESIQPKLMQFVNNYGSLEEAEPMVDALAKTIDHFA